MNPVQLALFSSVVSLTLALLIVLYFFIRFLKDLSTSTKHLNKILANFSDLSSSLVKPVSQLPQLIAGLREGIKLVRPLLEKRKNPQKKKR